jgi:hypothetical protein
LLKPAEMKADAITLPLPMRKDEEQIAFTHAYLV